MTKLDKFKDNYRYSEYPLFELTEDILKEKTREPRKNKPNAKQRDDLYKKEEKSSTESKRKHN